MTELGLTGWLALGLVMAVGLPHGAFDGAVALHLGLRRAHQMVLFLLAYLVLAGLVILFWLGLPELALTLFLALSMLHFGLADSRPARPLPDWLQAFCHGGLVSLLIPLAHREETDQLFVQLAAGPVPALWQLIEGGGLVWAIILAALVILSLFQPRLRQMVLEIALLGGLLWLLPPLAGFAFYFCGIHSARHFRRIWQSLSSQHGSRQLLLGAALLTLASWAAAALFFYWLSARQDLSTAGLQAVFILLAALTVPHMLLIDGWFRPRGFDRPGSENNSNDAFQQK